MTQLWRGIVEWSGDPRHLAVLATALLALAAVASRPVWRVSRTLVTIAHEGGHALAALAARRRLSGIRLHSDTSGVTVSSGPRRGFGMVVTVLAGYPSPSLLGLGGAALVAAGHTRPALWIAAGLLVATLVAVRNPYGALAVITTGALVVAVSWYLPPTTQAAFAGGLTWFLLFGGLRAAHELRTARKAQRRSQVYGGWAHGGQPVSDADQLAWLTGIPAGVWISVFVLVAASALGLGGWLLLG